MRLSDRETLRTWCGRAFSSRLRDLRFPALVERRFDEVVHVAEFYAYVRRMANYRRRCGRERTYGAAVQRSGVDRRPFAIAEAGAVSVPLNIQHKLMRARYRTLQHRAHHHGP